MTSLSSRLKEASYKLGKARSAAAIHPERFSNPLVETMCDGAELHRENGSERRASQLLREARLYVQDHAGLVSAETSARLEALSSPEASRITATVDEETESPGSVPLEATNTRVQSEISPVNTAVPDDVAAGQQEPDQKEISAPQPVSQPPVSTSPSPEEVMRAQFTEWLSLPQSPDPSGVILHYQNALEEIRNHPKQYSEALIAEIREATGRIYLAAGKLWDAERMVLLAFRNRLRCKDSGDSAEASRKTLRLLSEVYDEAGERRIARSHRDSARMREDEQVLKAVQALVEESRSDEEAA